MGLRGRCSLHWGIGRDRGEACLGRWARQREVPKSEAAAWWEVPGWRPAPRSWGCISRCHWWVCLGPRSLNGCPTIGNAAVIGTLTKSHHRIRESWPGPQQTRGTQFVERHLITGSQKLDTSLVPSAHLRVPELSGMSATLRGTGGRAKPLSGLVFPHVKPGARMSKGIPSPV